MLAGPGGDAPAPLPGVSLRPERSPPRSTASSPSPSSSITLPWTPCTWARSWACSSSPTCTRSAPLALRGSEPGPAGGGRSPTGGPGCCPPTLPTGLGGAVPAGHARGPSLRHQRSRPLHSRSPLLTTSRILLPGESGELWGKETGYLEPRVAPSACVCVSVCPTAMAFITYILVAGLALGTQDR